MFFKNLAVLSLGAFAAYCYFLGFIDVTVKIFGDNGGLGIIGLLSALIVFGSVWKYFYELFGIDDEE